jgi:hydrogenase/urease accessory protein HupE
MVAQRGTLNLVDDGAFMVLSLPVSAFASADDDGNGLLSAAELQAHASDIQRQVVQGVRLWSDAGERPLQGLMLQLSPDEHLPTDSARQLLAMGRFALNGQAQNLRLRLDLFGTGADEQTQNMVVSQGERAHRLVLSPAQPEGAVLPSAWRNVEDHVREGFAHVLSGPDHLLFLLVVLAAGGGWRRVVLALTCFTLGHAVTLTASVLGGFSLPASVVEPAIAATILGMAAFDQWQARYPERAWSPTWRLGLVFGCALIHGLGLAGALADLGLDTEHRLLSLLGFNIGIGLAQVAVACGAAAFMAVVVRWRGGAGRTALLRATTAIAWLAGSVWLVQRLVSGG